MTDERYMRPGIPFALGKLAEEIGEYLEESNRINLQMSRVLQAIGKTQRWGLDSVNPDLPEEQQETNEAWLHRELSILVQITAEPNLGEELKDVVEAMFNLAAQMLADGRG